MLFGGGSAGTRCEYHSTVTPFDKAWEYYAKKLGGRRFINPSLVTSTSMKTPEGIKYISVYCPEQTDLTRARTVIIKGGGQQVIITLWAATSDSGTTVSIVTEPLSKGNLPIPPLLSSGR